MIRKLLHKIFIPCACQKLNENTKSNTHDPVIMSDIDAVQQINWNDDMQENSNSSEQMRPVKRHCPGHEVCFSVDETVNELDIPEENISTLLCYLELHDQQYVKSLSKAYIQCKVLSYGGAKALKYVFIYGSSFSLDSFDMHGVYVYCLSLSTGLRRKSVHHLQWPSHWTYEMEFHMKIPHSLSFR